MLWWQEIASMVAGAALSTPPEGGDWLLPAMPNCSGICSLSLAVAEYKRFYTRIHYSITPC